MVFLSPPGLQAPAACYLSDPQRENGSGWCELLGGDRSWNLWLQEKHKDKVWIGGLRGGSGPNCGAFQQLMQWDMSLGGEKEKQETEFYFVSVSHCLREGHISKQVRALLSAAEKSK